MRRTLRSPDTLPLRRRKERTKNRGPHPKTIGDFQPLILSGRKYLNMDHTDWIGRIIRDHRWLDKLAQDYGRQRFRPEIESAEQMSL